MLIRARRCSASALRSTGPRTTLASSVTLRKLLMPHGCNNRDMTWTQHVLNGVLTREEPAFVIKCSCWFLASPFCSLEGSMPLCSTMPCATLGCSRLCSWQGENGRRVSGFGWTMRYSTTGRDEGLSMQESCFSWQG